MKTVFALALLGVLMTITGCEQTTHPQKDLDIQNTTGKVIQDVTLGDTETIVIDDCEYIIFKEAIGTNKGYGYMSHKGNCINKIHNYPTTDVNVSKHKFVLVVF